MDVLLARQYNLISTLAEQGALSGKGGSGSLSSLEEKTLSERLLVLTAALWHSGHCSGQRVLLPACACTHLLQCAHVLCLCAARHHNTPQNRPHRGDAP